MPESVLAPDVKYEPYWWDAAPYEPLPAVELPKSVDVVVLGAGYTGLSAALTLARGGRDVLVCEMGLANGGGSSRNQGQMGAVFKRSFSQLAASHGRDKAVAIMQSGRAAIEYTQSLIEREQISCDLERCGRFVAAYRREDYEALARELDVLKREFGFQGDMVPRSEQTRHIGSDFYFGGQVRHADATLQPARYHQGLIARVLAAGARIAENTPVTVIARDGSGFRLTTPRGVVAARDVFIATNAYTGDVTPDLRRRVIPLGAYIIATEPLSAERMRAVMPKPRALHDTRKLIFGMRLAPDRSRVMFGGRASLAETDPRRTAPRLHRRLVEAFPALEGVRVTHSWHGFVAFTFQYLPHIGTRDGAHFVLGCCGSGIAIGTYLGHKAALRILNGRNAENATPFDDLPFETRPLYSGRPWFIAPTMLAYAIKDALPRHHRAA